jgi:hypothetical protein
LVKILRTPLLLLVGDLEKGRRENRRRHHGRREREVGREK